MVHAGGAVVLCVPGAGSSVAPAVLAEHAMKLQRRACKGKSVGCVARLFHPQTLNPVGNHMRRGAEGTCRSAECFVQVVNLLNFEYEGTEGLLLAEKVLSTLAALLRGNEASRRRLVSNVGYDQILMAVRRQVGGTVQPVDV